MNTFDFLLTLLACLIANLIFWICEEQASINTSFIRWLFNRRSYFLSFLYKEIRKERLEGNSDDEIQIHLKKKYQNKSLPFMMSNTISSEDMVFISDVINDKNLLFGFAAVPDLKKKDYKKMLELMEIDEKKKEARSALMDILLDNSQSSIDKAMVWMPQLFITFVQDPERDREIKKTENHFSVFYYLKGEFIKDSVSHDKFLDCLTKLKKINPQMLFASSKSHSADYERHLSKSDGRREAVLDRVRQVINQN